MIIINVNENAFTKKMYVISVMNLKTSDTKTYSLFFYVVISCIMFSDESENELF